MVVFALFRASVLLSLLTLSTLAAPAPNTTAATNATVVTPAGARPNANVFAVPEGGKIVHAGDEIHVVDASGTVININKNDASTPSDGRLVAREESGWIAFAFWTNPESSPISSFTATWTVPTPPPSYTGQTLFLFNSIEAPQYASAVGSHTAIVFPVLQYGVSAAGGGAYWAIASWYIIGSNVYHTNLVTVQPGQSLVGEIIWEGEMLAEILGTPNNYAVYFSGIPSTTLFVFGSESLVLATTALQGYTVESDEGYPQIPMVFSSISMATAAGVPSLDWIPVSDWTGNSISVLCTITTQGATNAEVTIKVRK